MIDGDPATDGLSLFLLGQKGQEQISAFKPFNTFIGYLAEFARRNISGPPLEAADSPETTPESEVGLPNSVPLFEPHPIHRRGTEDHGVTYQALISGKGLYGNEDELTNQSAVPELDRDTFRKAIATLFDQLRDQGQFSYVLVDTRGGFAFESTDVCALADSFIVVTEPDLTSFYQDRNLVARISHAIKELRSPSLLRAMIVNKATDEIRRPDKTYLDNLEVSFRNELTKEFPIKFENTHPVPVDINALLAYKVQKLPYLTSPGTGFSFATLAAFSDILQLVTSRLTGEQVDRWATLVDKVADARKKRDDEEIDRANQAIDRERERDVLRAEVGQRDAEIEALKLEAAELKKQVEREYQRSSEVLKTVVNITAPQTQAKHAGRAWLLVPAPVLATVVSLVSATLVLLSWYHPASLPTKPSTTPSITNSNTNSNDSKPTAKLQSSASDGTLPNPDPSDPTLPSSYYAVLLSTDATLQATKPGGPSAAYEANLAAKANVPYLRVFEKSGMFITAAAFPTRSDANVALQFFSETQRTWATAYAVPLAKLCPVQKANGTLPVDGIQVPIIVCDDNAGP
jgi:hypothetical protein